MANEFLSFGESHRMTRRNMVGSMASFGTNRSRGIGRAAEQLQPGHRNARPGCQTPFSVGARVFHDRVESGIEAVPGCPDRKKGKDRPHALVALGELDIRFP